MTEEIEIYAENGCAWCEVGGRFIYGADADEVRAALKALAESPR